MGSKGQAHTETCRAVLSELLEAVAYEAAYPLSVQLIEEFGSLAAVLAADEYALHRMIPAFPQVRAFLGLIRKAMLHSLTFELDQAPVIATGHALRNYLFASLAHAKAEAFRVLFLDGGSRLIRDQLMGIGSVSQTSAYPREIVKRALELGAQGLILVHNHPSGSSSASASDIALTRKVATVCQHMELTLVDHIIIARTNWSSMREQGLL